MLKSVESVPFKAADYPITVAEVPQASEMLDSILSDGQRDELIDCLAYQPDVGEPLEDCVGVRVNVFAFDTPNGTGEITVVYFFHDLNMPLYVLAAYEGHKAFSLEPEEVNQMNSLAAKLVLTGMKNAARAFQQNA